MALDAKAERRVRQEACGKICNAESSDVQVFTQTPGFAIFTPLHFHSGLLSNSSVTVILPRVTGTEMNQV